MSALLDCQYVGGPAISEEKCKNAVAGYEEGSGQGGGEKSDKEVTM